MDDGINLMIVISHFHCHHHYHSTLKLLSHLGLDLRGDGLILDFQGGDCLIVLNSFYLNALQKICL